MKRFEQPGMMPEPTDAEKVKQVRAIMKQATSWTPVVHKTRFTELGFWNVPSSPGEGPSFWQFVDLTGDKPAQVGYQYATKAELLANLEAYATEYGCENASPKPRIYGEPVVPHHMSGVDYLRAKGYAVVVFTPEELAGARRNRVEDRLCELGWEVIADLKP